MTSSWYPLPPFSPSLISLVVSVDVKHHVYFFIIIITVFLSTTVVINIIAILVASPPWNLPSFADRGIVNIPCGGFKALGERSSRLTCRPLLPAVCAYRHHLSRCEREKHVAPKQSDAFVSIQYAVLFTRMHEREGEFRYMCIDLIHWFMIGYCKRILLLYAYHMLRYNFNRITKASYHFSSHNPTTLVVIIHFLGSPGNLHPCSTKYTCSYSVLFTGVPMDMFSDVTSGIFNDVPMDMLSDVASGIFNYVPMDMFRWTYSMICRWTCSMTCQWTC